MTTTTFEQWMIKVDAAVIKRAGLSVHDLADICFADFYEDGMTPSQVAKIALAGEGF